MTEEKKVKTNDDALDKDGFKTVVFGELPERYKSPHERKVAKYRLGLKLKAEVIFEKFNYDISTCDEVKAALDKLKDEKAIQFLDVDFNEMESPEMIYFFHLLGRLRLSKAMIEIFIHVAISSRPINCLLSEPTCPKNV